MDNTINLLALGLRATNMRETALAYQIANVNLNPKTHLEVNFETQLQAGTETAKPFYENKPDALSLDELMLASLTNASHTQILLKGLNQKLAQLTLAIEGDKA